MGAAGLYQMAGSTVRIKDAPCRHTTHVGAAIPQQASPLACAELQARVGDYGYGAYEAQICFAAGSELNIATQFY
jgi:hypothetical protein